jgi:hypothetical protein
MPPFQRPLAYRRIARTGDIALRAELTLEIQTSTLNWESVDFLVDTGTEISTMPARRARHLGIPFPENPIPGLLLNNRPIEIRAGSIRARLLGLDHAEFDFPCYFLGDPDQPVDPLNPSKLPRSLLGLSGVLDKFRILFDGTPSPDYPRGFFRLETLV